MIYHRFKYIYKEYKKSLKIKEKEKKKIFNLEIVQ